jgi:hypothetical protein
MCVLSDKGDEGRPLSGNGGGVIDKARGLLGLEGEGDRTGEEAPFVILPVARAKPVSSSERVLGSSSFNSDETKGAPSLAGAAAVAGSALELELEPDGPGTDGAAPEFEAVVGCVGMRLVRGRFSLRSG